MGEPAKTFEDLIVWQKVHELVLDVYRMTRSFPKEEMFGLTSQIRRAAVSAPSNILEGFNRRGTDDKARFYKYSEASLKEVRYQLLLSKDLGYADTTDLQEKAKETKRVLHSSIEAVRTK